MVTARALLDAASDTSLVDLNWVQKTGLPLWDVNAAISGVGGQRAAISTRRTVLRLQVAPSCSHPGSQSSIPVSALVLKNLNIRSPSVDVRRERWDHIDQLTLADPTFCRSKKVEVILGADIYS